jgi:hypothetical protein
MFSLSVTVWCRDHPRTWQVKLKGGRSVAVCQVRSPLAR